jgi:nitroimidazol reductase NimA-like FMN-containing flavoprotein (pyridoxamine 5'-phosphate oxidase superfamily)
MTNPLTMPPDEREAFLAQLHVAVLSIGRGSGGPPITGPVWYAYEPGGEVEMSIGASSRKAAALRVDASASLCVQSEELPYRFVTVSGPVQLGPSDEDVRRRIAARYLPAEMVDGYLATAEDPSEMLTVRLSTRTWYSNDFSKYM